MLNSFLVMHALKPGKFTKNVWLINDFAAQDPVAQRGDKFIPGIVPTQG